MSLKYTLATDYTKVKHLLLPALRQKTTLFLRFLHCDVSLFFTAVNFALEVL